MLFVAIIATLVKNSTSSGSKQLVKLFVCVKIKEGSLARNLLELRRTWVRRRSRDMNCQLFLTKQVKKKRFHGYREDVGMAVANKVWKLV